MSVRQVKVHGRKVWHARVAFQGLRSSRVCASRDAAKLQTVLADVYRDGPPDPADITKFEWEAILRYLGASAEEIKDVQLRMGRVWR